jgi:two-component system, OmpR family, alkaline phosphatase synthesis response regulator PhoP
MKKMIFVIDDDPDIRVMMKELLETVGYDVRTYESGRKALEQMDIILPSAVLLDLMIPDENGFETCRDITQSPRTSDVPVIILTGRNSIDCKLAGFCSGARRYLTKPAEPMDLIEAVNIVVQKQAQTHVRAVI